MKFFSHGIYRHFARSQLTSARFCQQTCFHIAGTGILLRRTSPCDWDCGSMVSHGACCETLSESSTQSAIDWQLGIHCSGNLGLRPAHRRRKKSGTEAPFRFREQEWAERGLFFRGRDRVPLVCMVEDVRDARFGDRPSTLLVVVALTFSQNLFRFCQLRADLIASHTPEKCAHDWVSQQCRQSRDRCFGGDKLVSPTRKRQGRGIEPLHVPMPHGLKPCPGTSLTHPGRLARLGNARNACTH